MKPKVFIDGKEGTTGLQIYERLGQRSDIALITISDDKRKDLDERRKCLNEADLVFLCLPDEAAIEAVSLIDNPDTKVIDASTAHRTADGWVYGFPELGLRDKIRNSKRVANPGCHATGFLSVVKPLVECNIINSDMSIACYSLTGYSGGGKKMILEYQAHNRSKSLDVPKIYGLDLNHKHIPEMMAVAGLTAKPIFTPIVDDYYSGMVTTVMLQNSMLNSCPTADSLRDVLAAYYLDQRFVIVRPFAASGNFLISDKLSGTNMLLLEVNGDEERTVISAVFDNLGKGASGAAVQNMNIMLGFDEEIGLD